MLVKLVLKLLLKATVPLIAVAGVLSYGLYLKGGDPMAMWSKVGSKMMGSMRESGTRTAQSVQSLSPVGQASSTKKTVYSWVDASGTTHYGSNPPPGVTARALTIRSSSSTVAPPPVPQPSAHSIPTGGSASGLDENLPGMAGVKLPIDIQPEDLGLTREELLNMLKSK